MYIAVWGSSRAKEDFLKLFSEQLARPVSENDIDFILYTSAHMHTVRSFYIVNLPGRANFASPYIQYLMKTVHAHIIIGMPEVICKTIFDAVSLVGGEGVCFSWDSCHSNETIVKLPHATHRRDIPDVLTYIISVLVKRGLLEAKQSDIDISALITSSMLSDSGSRGFGC